MSSFPPELKDVRFPGNVMHVLLEDGRRLDVPLERFPRLLHADPRQRAAVELSPCGLHWDEIDEDISVAGVIAGRGDMTRRPPHVA